MVMPVTQGNANRPHQCCGCLLTYDEWHMLRISGSFCCYLSLRHSSLLTYHSRAHSTSPVGTCQASRARLFAKREKCVYSYFCCLEVMCVHVKCEQIHQGLEPKRMGCFCSIWGLFMCRFVRFMYILIDRVYINPFPFAFSKYPFPFIS